MNKKLKGEIRDIIVAFKNESLFTLTETVDLIAELVDEDNARKCKIRKKKEDRR